MNLSSELIKSESTGSLLPTLATRHYISSQSLSPLSSTLFEHDGDALAAADAGRADAQLLSVLPELVDEVAADARAGGAQRVPDGDGTAARVELWGWRHSAFKGKAAPRGLMRCCELRFCLRIVSDSPPIFLQFLSMTSSPKHGCPQ